MARDAHADGAEHVAQHLEVERALAAEVVVEHRLVDARLGGDAVHAGGVEAALGELLGGGRENGGVGRLAGSSSLLGSSGFN